ncbi:redoxin family protein [Candidatus Azambacteria bacterium]|nr:redoxin family protein [Candidatus Azambacteria bacterium]
MTSKKTLMLFALVGVVIAAIVYLNAQKPPRAIIGGTVEVKTAVHKEDLSAGRQEKQNRYPVAKEITTPDGFINTDGKPITIGEFIGKKVVLVDFWTYSCINCQRTTPYLNAWYEKYKDKGFVIIGMHTPEFEFEKNYQNVLDATKRLGIKYPVVLDNDFSTWNAYQNRFWPRKYLIDIDGYIVYDHAGEGAYEETEQKIQKLLEERMTVLGVEGEIAKDVSKPTGVADVDFSLERSPEIYFGAARNTYLGNGDSGTQGVQTLEQPQRVKTNTLYLTGEWEFLDEFAKNRSAGAKIIFRYQAKNVYFVANAKGGVTVEIFKDGTSQGTKFVQGEELYQLVADMEYGEHTLEMIVESPGLEAFTFTFG